MIFQLHKQHSVILKQVLHISFLSNTEIVASGIAQHHVMT